MSSLVLGTFKNVDRLSNLFQCLIILTLKKLFLSSTFLQVFCMLCPLPLVLSLSSTKSLSPSFQFSARCQVIIPFNIPLNLLQTKHSWAFLWRQILQLFNWLCDLRLDTWLGTFVQSPASVSCGVEKSKREINWWRNTRECLNNSVEKNQRQQWQWCRSILESYQHIKENIWIRWQSNNE